jgi:hypothetical protein
MVANQPCIERRIDEEFLAIVCSDEDFLRAEFEAIIAAEWSPMSPTPKLTGTAGLPPLPNRRRWRVGQAPPPTQPPCPSVGERSRQRSPPARRPLGPGSTAATRSRGSFAFAGLLTCSHV